VFRIRISSKRSFSFVECVLLITLFSLISFFFWRPLILAPLFLLLLCVVRWLIQACPASYRLPWTFFISLSLGISPLFSSAGMPVYGFSFLFENTEKVLNNCIFNNIQVTGVTLTVISSILFGGLRVAFMLGVGVAGYLIWQRRQAGQDFQDLLGIVLVAILITLGIGFMEPLIVGTGGCGTGV
jgi:hypothetical protein